jgi:hypothetical protein
MINLRWSFTASAAAFVISFVLGISVRGRILIVLIRALGFGVFFFFLAALIWYFLNRYIPELLQDSSPQDLSPAPDLSLGNQVNIVLEDEALPQDETVPHDAALPPEETADDSVGNIEEIADRPPEESPGAWKENPGGGILESPPVFASEDPVSAEIPGGSRGMDQGSQSGYTEDESLVSRVLAPSIQAPAGGFLGLEDASGDVESLPDLDALVGNFLSPAAAGEDESASSPRPAGGARSKKGRNVEEDFNPKELASAIQTILKRD